MVGKLYGIGLGPGDPGLVTLRARDLLGSCDVIAYPVRKPGEGGVALDIVRAVIDTGGRRMMESVFSMSPDGCWDDCHDDAVEGLCSVLGEGLSVAMVTLGDVGVYSTFMYVKERIESRGFEVELVPGVTSFCHGAALAGKPLVLGDEGLAVIPMAYDSIDMLSSALDTFDSVVLMKASRSMDDIVSVMQSKGVPLSSATVMSNIGMPDQYIGPMDPGRSYGYFTTVLIKRDKEEKA